MGYRQCRQLAVAVAAVEATLSTVRCKQGGGGAPLPLVACARQAIPGLARLALFTARVTHGIPSPLSLAAP
jgi:hypothetical protein